MTERLAVEDLRFEVRRSDRRKTLEIIVDRGGELVLVSPEHATHSALEGFVRAKRFWIYAKLAHNEPLHRPVARKEFVSGEGFPYLGRIWSWSRFSSIMPNITANVLCHR